MELEGRELLCDCVLSATGRSGAVDGLNLEAGLGREMCTGHLENGVRNFGRSNLDGEWASTKDTENSYVLIGFIQVKRENGDLVTVSFGICVGPRS